MSLVYSLITKNILVSVTPEYSDEFSMPSDSHYVWLYHIKIENKGKQPVQLISRYWNITDAKGTVSEVRGDGVIGKQPNLAVGEVFEYSSSVPLTTITGIMHGTYTMKFADGHEFTVKIPTFSLDSDIQIQRPN